MPRPGHAASRGYGHHHRVRVAQLKAALRDGDPCARCGGPMYRTQLPLLDGDHVGTPRALQAGDPHHRDALPDALAHRSCNRSHGASLGNRLRALRRDATTTRRADRRRDATADKEPRTARLPHTPPQRNPQPRAWLTDDEP